MDPAAPPDPHPQSRAVATRSAAELAAAMAAGDTTAHEVTTTLLERIAALHGEVLDIHAVLAVSADAPDQAARLDAERASGTVRSPWHGVPVLIKDNIEAVGLPTTAGSLALAGRPVVRDSTIAARLRSAGLVVLGATNLSEWANFRGSPSPSGWSAVGGLAANPWALDRSTGGSSAGSSAALVAGLAPFAVGTETDGSIVCPSALNGCVGLKPTVGVVPTDGVVPISASQDSPGPMARSVADVAALHSVLADDPGAIDAIGALALRDARLGVANAWITGHGPTDSVFADVISQLTNAGATAFDVDVPNPDVIHPAEVTVLVAEIHDDMNAYLSARPGDGARSLADLVAFNERHAELELAHFGQQLFEAALRFGGRAGAGYAEARAECVRWAIDRCLAPAFATAGAPDVIVAPAYTPAWKSDLVLGDHPGAGGHVTTAAAIAGWPVLCVPMGLVAGLPVGMALVGRPNSEHRLLAIGHAIEATLALTTDAGWRPAWRAAAAG
jgi:amidase